ncbi:DUF2635 domain-containing protein [Moritella sp. F3]|uniref:DUF2635 domain-containing protein n=1 Tax=Moritella sp. F3 TaxID=2718882 RepID=UPI0018E14D4B|nr:DUF2635 domain-containing protein [Moritella sp. F3]GIC79503.1 DUF2635 domain-containing protein [Moritella sp. F1]GIC79781.1 DUF2635 domain-containing protein [Moritella sp. F3]
MREIKVKPKKGLLVRDPNTREPLKAAGELKPRNTYWLRRINDADVLLVTESKKETKS